MGADSKHPEDRSRRRFLAGCAGASLFLARPSFAGRSPRAERGVNLLHLHTGERLRTLYWADGHYDDDALRSIARLLRDHRTGDRHPIDPALLDVLDGLQERLDTRREFHVISGYRSPQTNTMLQTRSNGVARKSLHMEGKAIDIRAPGRSLDQLHRAALSLRAGGVGLYRQSRFVHVDTGRVRTW